MSICTDRHSVSVSPFTENQDDNVDAESVQAASGTRTQHGCEFQFPSECNPFATKDDFAPPFYVDKSTNWHASNFGGFDVLQTDCSLLPASKRARTQGSAGETESDEPQSTSASTCASIVAVDDKWIITPSPPTSPPSEEFVDVVVAQGCALSAPVSRVVAPRAVRGAAPASIVSSLQTPRHRTAAFRGASARSAFFSPRSRDKQ